MLPAIQDATGRAYKCYRHGNRGKLPLSPVLLYKIPLSADSVSRCQNLRQFLRFGLHERHTSRHPLVIRRPFADIQLRDTSIPPDDIGLFRPAGVLSLSECSKVFHDIKRNFFSHDDSPFWLGRLLACLRHSRVLLSVSMEARLGAPSRTAKRHALSLIGGSAPGVICCSRKQHKTSNDPALLGRHLNQGLGGSVPTCEGRGRSCQRRAGAGKEIRAGPWGPARPGGGAFAPRPYRYAIRLSPSAP